MNGTDWRPDVERIPSGGNAGKQQKIGEIGKKRRVCSRYGLLLETGKDIATICSFFNIFFILFSVRNWPAPLSISVTTRITPKIDDNKKVWGEQFPPLQFPPRCAPGGGFSNKKKEEASSHIYLYYSFFPCNLLKHFKNVSCVSAGSPPFDFQSLEMCAKMKTNCEKKEWSGERGDEVI